jgi:hypothetical protein
MLISSFNSASSCPISLAFSLSAQNSGSVDNISSSITLCFLPVKSKAALRLQNLFPQVV